MADATPPKIFSGRYQMPCLPDIIWGGEHTGDLSLSAMKEAELGKQHELFLSHVTRQRRRSVV